MTNQTARDKTTPRQSNGSASALALAGAASSTIANFGVVVALNSASTTTAGIFFAATSVITILGNSSSLGTMTGLVYFMPRVKTDDSDNPRSLLKVAFAPVVACGTLFAIGIAALAPTIGELIANDGAAEVARMLRILAITIPAWAITIPALGGTRALGSMTPTAVIGRVFRPVGQVGLMASVAVFSEDPTPTKFAVAWGLPVVVAACASVVALQRLGGFHHQGTATVSQREFWAFVRPRSASTALQIALERVDVILVSALAPLAGIQGELAAGIYGTLSRFITAANFLVASLTQAVTPKIRRALAKNNTAGAQRLIDQTSGWMVMLIWPYLLIVAIQPIPLLELVTTSEDAAMGANALTILALGVLLSPVAGPADGTLLMLGHSGWSLLGIAAAIVVDVGLAIALIPSFGITGAAIAWVVAVAVANGLPLFLTNRLGGLRPGPGRPALIAAICATVAVVPIGIATPDTLVGMFSTTAVAGVLMAGLIIRFARDLSVPVSKIPVLRSLISS